MINEHSLILVLKSFFTTLGSYDFELHPEFEKAVMSYLFD